MTPEVEHIVKLKEQLLDALQKLHSSDEQYNADIHMALLTDRGLQRYLRGELS